MLKAYVGVASRQGLAVLQPERDESLSLVRSSVRGNSYRVGFWAVLDDSDAPSVQTLFRHGYRQEALLLLNCAARDIGRILPSELLRGSLR